jgi:hypothetical protein
MDWSIADYRPLVKYFVLLSLSEQKKPLLVRERLGGLFRS